MSHPENQPRNRASKRFGQSIFTSILIPAILIILALALLSTIIFIVLFASGII